MRRMLDPKTIGGGGGNLPSTIEFDKDGNRKLSANLEVDGNWISPYSYNKYYNKESKLFTIDNNGSSVYMFSGRDSGGSPCFGPVVEKDSTDSLDVKIEYSNTLSQSQHYAALARKQFSHNILLTGESNQIVRIIALLNGITSIKTIAQLTNVLSSKACLQASGSVLLSGEKINVAYVSAENNKLYAYDINGNSVDISNFVMTAKTAVFQKPI